MPAEQQRPRAFSTNYLKVVFSPGVAPDKWFTRFDERTHGWKAAGAQVDDPLKFITAGKADIAIMRLGASEENAGPGLHHVRLYGEQVGVAAPREHPIKVLDAVSFNDLSDEMVMYRTPDDGIVDIDAVREALGVVGANVGVCIAPRPLLRTLNQRGVVHRDLLGADEVGQTRIALVWKIDRDDEVIQDFVGICRGRKEGSGRQNLTKRGVKNKAAAGRRNGKTPVKSQKKQR